ncbi:ZIP zinc transporter domain-containing protein [Ditylenchus destructor]|uniref:Zinc transporter ZIP11 n=1 Tax=Ditylenchus destructor TaxID=166010 RepID=A0AAD4N8L3_9BILA|nr:ZIP zinc transporter domain-containing protein [Ditylenchus destructor]
MIVNYDPILQALLASLFTWGVTALGAALVFVLPANSKKFLDVSLGFAGGVMTAASFWSLLAPAIEISEQVMGSWAFVPVAVGFALGALFVHFSDNLIPSCVVAEISLINVLTKERHHLEAVAANQKCRFGKPNSKGDSNAVLLLESQTSSNQQNTGSAAQQRLEQNRLSELGTLARTEQKSDQTLLRHRLRSSRAPQMPSHLPFGVEDVESENRNAEDISQNGSNIERRDEVSDSTITGANQSHADLMISWRRILLLIMAVTVHNIPEGLAVGVGFGSVGKSPAATFEKAFNLAIGIGLQNFPEGLAVSLPLAAFGCSKLKAFMYGQASGMVEPFAALLGAAAVLLMEPVLPYALAFAAGAMIYVVFDDIIPEAQRNGNGKLASAGTIVGFLVMMCMDVGLG